jgi:hypothetical protein
MEGQDRFDRLIAGLKGLPDVAETQPSTILTHVPLLGNVQTFVVHTVRQRDQGDTVFVQCIDGADSYRIAFPPAVAAAIARQRDSLTTIIRKRHAKRIAAENKAAGKVPAFLRGKKTSKAKGKK